MIEQLSQFGTNEAFTYKVLFALTFISLLGMYIYHTLQMSSYEYTKRRTDKSLNKLVKHEFHAFHAGQSYSNKVLKRALEIYSLVGEEGMDKFYEEEKKTDPFSEWMFSEEYKEIFKDEVES